MDDFFLTGTGRRLEQTVLPTPNSVDLSRTVETDFLSRFTSRTPHIAELYHENSKLLPSLPMSVESPAEQRKQICEWYFNTSYNFSRDDVDIDATPRVFIRPDDLHPKLQALIELFHTNDQAKSLLYALDLFLLFESVVYRYIPGKHILWVERFIEHQADFNLLRDGLFELELSPQAACQLAFLVAVPWRYMMLYGPRGYRHTLMDTGRVLQIVTQQSDFVESCNFYDQHLDRFLELDGTERSVVAVLGARSKRETTV